MWGAFFVIRDDVKMAKDAHTYEYDYEKRITKTTKSGPITVAEYVRDALGRRIKKVDSTAGTTNIHYYNKNGPTRGDLRHIARCMRPPTFMAMELVRRLLDALMSG